MSLDSVQLVLSRGLSCYWVRTGWSGSQFRTVSCRVRPLAVLNSCYGQRVRVQCPDGRMRAVRLSQLFDRLPAGAECCVDGSAA